MTADLLSAALACARRGWPVIPLRPGSKKPALHGYDRCPHTGPCAGGHRGWEQRATTDPQVIRRAWSTGRYNIGLATGPAGLLVIDLDVRKPGEVPPPPPWNQPGVTSGEDVFLLVCDQAGQVPPVDTFTAATPSGGTHLYYQAPAGPLLRNTAGSLLGWKIDTRAHGGYVVAPGSTIAGRSYRVVLDRGPIPLPGWLAARLAAPPTPTPAAEPVRVRHHDAYLDAAVADTAARLKATTTSRNAALYGAAVSLGRFVAAGDLTEAEHQAVLLDAAAGHLAVRAYSHRQALATIASGLRAGQRHGRQAA